MIFEGELLEFKKLQGDEEQHEVHFTHIERE